MPRFGWVSFRILVERVRIALKAWPYSIEKSLFGLVIIIYLATRLIGLVDFPIYFFTDEAVQTVLAADLVRDHFHNYDKVFLPTYFKNGSNYNLSLSVYLQVLPYLLFQKSVFVTRLTSVLVTLLAAYAVGLVMRDFFNARFWWAGTLILSVTPAWFLHSRTAFETVLFCSLYAGLLFAYLLYRYRSPRYVYLVLLVAALAFYTYSPGQLIVVLTGSLLLLSDAGYHWRNRAQLARGLAVLVALAIPYLRFRLSTPFSPVDHLAGLGSYWVQPLPLPEKVSHFISEYLYGLSPAYWFVPNNRDLVRHLMKGYGHLLPPFLPFAVLGLLLVIKELRSSAHRLLLIAMLVAPVGGALVQIGITRLLVMVIPATLLTTFGLSKTLQWLERPRVFLEKIPRFTTPAWLQRIEISGRTLSLGLFSLLALLNGYMLRDALVNGPTWFNDYGLGGMQYGARQLFGAVEDYLESHPGTNMVVSPSWSNGTDVVARFFLPEPLPIQMGSVEGYLFSRQELDENTLFVMIPEEYEKAVSSGKFTDIHLEQGLYYPDRRIGFYFVRMMYVDDIDQILEAEREARRALVETQVTWKGLDVQVKHSPLDIGEIKNGFDGDQRSLFRTLEANPAVLELTFSQPVTASALYLRFGSTQVDVLAQLFPAPDAAPLETTASLVGSVEKPDGWIDFARPVTMQKLRLEIKDAHQQEPGHVHVWEIDLR